jgi:arsenate reductase
MLGQNLFEVTSAGLEASEVNSTAVAAMTEIGIDITRQTSKPLSRFRADDFDLVISLCGCGVNLPEGWTSREIFEDWFIDDPDGRPMEAFREAREQIKARVIELVETVRRSTAVVQGT